MQNVNLSPLPKDGERVLQELSSGHMVVARSGNDFIYIVDDSCEFQLFSHSPASQTAGRKRLPKDEKHSAIVRNVAGLADSLFLVEFDKGWNIYGVMAGAEEGILAMFPGDDRDADRDVEFVLPDRGRAPA